MPEQFIIDDIGWLEVVTKRPPTVSDPTPQPSFTMVDVYKFNDEWVKVFEATKGKPEVEIRAAIVELMVRHGVNPPPSQYTALPFVKRIQEQVKKIENFTVPMGESPDFTTSTPSTSPTTSDAA
jgi:hypothetical protein